MPKDWRERCYENEDGDLMKPRHTVGWGGTDIVHDVNMTVLFQSAPRRTQDPDLLVLEAELRSEDDSAVRNPAMPADTDVAERAKARIERKGLQPLWKPEDVVCSPFEDTHELVGGGT